LIQVTMSISTFAILCLSPIEKSKFLTDRNVAESARGVELDDNNSLI